MSRRKLILLAFCQWSYHYLVMHIKYVGKTAKYGFNALAWNDGTTCVRLKWFLKNLKKTTKWIGDNDAYDHDDGDKDGDALT